MIEELLNKPNHKKLIILSSIVVALLVLLVVVFQPNTASVMTSEIRRWLSVEGNQQEEVKSIEFTSNDYDAEGSWKVTKSAKWLAKDEAQIDIEVESVLKRTDAKYKDIIFVLDVSGSMTGSKIETVKSDATDLINYLMTPEEGEEVGNTAALITFSDHSTIKQSFTNDKDVLTQKIQEIEVGGNTNYNEPLQQVDEIMEDYNKLSDHDTVVFFLTDGLPNVDTPNQIGTYRMLKEKYPYLVISGVQYEMGNEVVEEIKQISDEQYSTTEETLRDAMYEIATRPIKYNKFYLEDIINDDFFNVTSLANITSTKGDYSLQTTEDNKQKVIWSMNYAYVTGEKETLTIKIKLKDEFVDNYGFYPTNNSTKVIYKLQDSEDIVVSTTDSPVLTNKFKVIYDTNTPEGCTLPSIPSEEYYIYSRVDQITEELTCDGYVFDGYKTDYNDEKDITRINDNTFIMPSHDVTIRGTWSKVSITKSMEGSIHEKKTLYKVLEDEAAIGIYAKQYLGYHQDSLDEEVLYDENKDWETNYDIISTLTKSDITRIDDGSSYPFSYNEETHEWSSTNQNIDSSTSSIKFKIDSSKIDGIFLHCKVSSEYYDRLTVKIDGTPLTTMRNTNEQYIDLSIISNDSIIEVSYTKDSSRSGGTDTASFTIPQVEIDKNYVGNGKPKIYHWYADNSEIGKIIQDKNNVLFANHCWRMIRTTDTGGVKLFYNGEAEDGKCLNNRGKHLGYGLYSFDGYASRKGTYASNYYYGTDYYYNKESKKFSLSGEITTGEVKIGQFTCKSTSSSEVCDKIYYIHSFVEGDTYYHLPIDSNQSFNSYGSLAYQYDDNSPAYLGYMYNKVYELSYDSYNSKRALSSNYDSSRTSFWCSDSYIFDDGFYKLVNPILITTDNYQEAVGKYSFLSSNKNTNSTYIRYIGYISSSLSNIYYIEATNNESIDNYTLTYGKNYIENADGTYTIDNPQTIYRSEYYQYKYELRNKYVCYNATNNTCNELWYIPDDNYDSYTFKYLSSNNTKYFSDGFTYDGSKYILNDDKILVWNRAKNDKHYFCNNGETSCEKISYEFGTKGQSYFTFENGIGFDEAIDEMLYSNDVNMRDSEIKTGLELWYKKNMQDYTPYLEDTLFCYTRKIKQRNVYSFDIDHQSSLYCPNITDRFSTTNSHAKTEYPVGNINRYEFDITIYTLEDLYDPYFIVIPGSTTGYSISVYYNGLSGHATNVEPVRPVISLKPGMEYTEGDGSMEHPYYIETDVNSG